MPNLQGTNEEVSEEAESNLQEKLNAMSFGTDLPVPEPEPEDPTPDPDPEPEPDPEADPEPESELTAEKPNEDGSKDTDSTPEAGDKVEIPEGYVRAAKRQGWKDGDIAKTIEADPDLALRIFGNAYETSNKATRDFAAIGRARADATAKELAEQNKTDEPEIKDYMTADDIAKAADGDVAIAAMLTTMNQVAKEQAVENAKLRRVGPSNQDIGFARSDQDAATARANAAADEASNMLIEQFFSAEGMKPYDGFYGVVGENRGLTPVQRDHRIEVLQLANQLIIGKAAQNIQITEAEALEDAHLSVTDSMRKKVMVDDIRSSLTKRSKGKTLQPSKSRKTSSTTDGPAKNKEEAIANAEGRLAKLKW